MMRLLGKATVVALLALVGCKTAGSSQVKTANSQAAPSAVPSAALKAAAIGIIVN